MKTAVVIGAGASGLSAALGLRETAQREGLPLGVRLLEAAGRPGGKLETEVVDGYQIEWAAQGWTGSAHYATEMALRLGLEEELCVANPAASTRYIFRGGRLHPISPNPVSLVTTGVLSLPGKLRILAEPWIPPRLGEGDESVESFAERRMGGEAARVLMSAVMGGIFAGDSRKLSITSAFPQMRRMETEHGSLVRAALALMKSRRSAPPRPGPRGAMLCFRSGMERWATALAARLGDSLETGRAVKSLLAEGAGYRLETESGEDVRADAVVIATDAPRAAELLAPMEPGAAEVLRLLPSAPVAVVALAFPQGAFKRSADGYGFLVSRGEKLRVLGALWETNVFPGRAPEGHALLRVMIGGANAPERVDLDDEALVRMAVEDLERSVGLSAPPSRSWVRRHRPAITQYNVGHAERCAEVDRALAGRPGLFATGSAYRGVSVAACLEDGLSTAGRALKALGFAKSS